MVEEYGGLATIADDEIPGLLIRAVTADHRARSVLASRCEMTLRRDRSCLRSARLRGLEVAMPLLVVFFGLAVGAGLVVNQLLPGWPTLALVGALVAMAFLAFLFNDSPTLRSNSATRDADLERLERRIAEVSMTIRLLRELQN